MNAIDDSSAARGRGTPPCGATPTARGRDRPRFRDPSHGNIATEDLAYMCSEMGLDTGVDIDGVRAVSRRVAAFLGRTLPSHVLTAGTKQELMALNRL